jgi:COMPASS component SPP1
MTESTVMDKKILQQLEKQYEQFQNAPKYNLDSEEVFCTCRKPDNGELMVACDGCDEWFHFKCMGLNKKNKELVKSFYCTFCDLLFHKGKSMWKRKCKLTECYKPINEGSQFCSEDHGKKYWQSFLNKFTDVSNISIDNNYDSTEIINKPLVENLLQFVNTRNDLLTLGEELPLYDKGELLVTDEQSNELKSNENQINKMNVNIGNFKLKLNYLFKLKTIISELNNILTISLNPENNLENNEDDKNTEFVTKKNQKLKKNQKPKKFKIDICGFDNRLLLSDKKWKEFSKTSTFNDILNFENISTSFESQITETYKLLKSDHPNNIDSNLILSKLCISDKRKCHLHNGWFEIINDGLELKINEQNLEIEKKNSEITNMKQFIQIKNWKIYCNDV